MVARNTFEVRRTYGPVVSFRTVDADEVGPADQERPVMVYTPNNDTETYLTGAEVEALHEFTYGILAGRARDPRLGVVDAEVRCGFQWAGRDKVPHECALDHGHGSITPGPHGEITHVDSWGVPYVEVPF